MMINADEDGKGLRLVITSIVTSTRSFLPSIDDKS